MNSATLPRAAHVHSEDFIDQFADLQDITSGKYFADDYDFKQPKSILDTRQALLGGYNEDDFEVFGWPGGYTNTNDGRDYADARIEQLAIEGETVRGSGVVRNIAPGYFFDLEKYPVSQYNQCYLITAAKYNFTENVQRSDGGGNDTATTYRINFTAVPFSVSYRVKPHTDKPRTHGPQTAVVVGPSSEEIWTDQYGRVKVQFFWDRYGKMDQNSSCWIRVSQTWAGGNYGTMHVPRIGQEVIVDFLNGDPDFPIITGRVYNAMQIPPWDLPANKTQSGIKTRSTPNGTPGDGVKDTPGTTNIIRFEDRAEHEQLWFHAQKDQLTEVENQEDKWVGADRNKTIDGNETNVIHQNRTETVDQNETITIHQNRTETVDQNETITIHQNRTEQVDQNEQVTIGQNQQHAVGINRTRIVGADESVTVGANRTMTIASDETDTIGSNSMITVGSMEMKTIGMANIQNVGIAKMTNVGAMNSENTAIFKSTIVGMMENTAVGMERTIEVGGSQSVTIGGLSEMTAGGGHNLTAPAVNVFANTIDLAGQSVIVLAVGGSSIVITPGSISINAPMVYINSGGGGGGTATAPPAATTAPVAAAAPAAANTASSSGGLDGILSTINGNKLYKGLFQAGVAVVGQVLSGKSSNLLSLLGAVTTAETEKGGALNDEIGSGDPALTAVTALGGAVVSGAATATASHSSVAGGIRTALGSEVTKAGGAAITPAAGDKAGAAPGSTTTPANTSSTSPNTPSSTPAGGGNPDTNTK